MTERDGVGAAAADGAPPPRPATIRDVAREAGVSKSLVSLVFTGGDNVSEERRQRVLHAAGRLGYRPNLVAQSLSSGRRDLIAILVSNLHNPLFADIVAAAKSRLAEAGRRTMIISAQVDDGSGERVLDRDNIAVLRDLRPSGLITVGTIPEFEELAELTAAVPTVVASAIDATVDTVATVRVDDEAGIGMVVDHLIERGVRSIVFIGGDGGTVSASRERAFRTSVERHGLGADARVERADFTQSSARLAVGRLIASGRLPEAIVTINDLSAVAVISELEAAGIPVPGGCRVTGYDDTTLSAIPRISLTSVDPDNRRIGREAAEALLAAAYPGDGAADEARRRGREVLIPPTLVVRGSSGPGPSRA